MNTYEAEEFADNMEEILEREGICYITHEDKTVVAMRADIYELGVLRMLEDANTTDEEKEHAQNVLDDVKENEHKYLTLSCDGKVRNDEGSVIKG